MEDIRHIRLPPTEEIVRSLRTGDMVMLDGEIVLTAGLPTHHRMLQAIREGTPLPRDLTGAGLFHLGSYSREIEGGGFEVLYMNPTTSTRFNALMPELIRSLKLRAVGGKGGLDAACVAAMQEVGCVYFSFVGGGCPLLSDAIERVISVHWNDLVSHYRLVTLGICNLGPASWLSAAEKRALTQSLAADLRPTHRLSIAAGLSDTRIWMMCALLFANAMATYALAFWLPSIIRASGVSGMLNIGLLTAIPFGVATVAMLIVARHSDHRRERRWHIFFSAAIGAAGLAFSTYHSNDIPLALSGLSVAAAGMLSATVVFWCLPNTILHVRR